MIIRGLLEEFKRRLETLYGNRLVQIILYGSYARGDFTDESDVDLLVILRGEVLPGKEIDRMIDIITDINLKYGVLLSVYPISEDDFKRVNSPLLINIRREGIKI